MIFHVYLNKTDQGLFWLRQGNRSMGPDITISPQQAKNHEQAVTFSRQAFTAINNAAANGDSSVITILHDEISGQTYTIGGDQPLSNTQSTQGNSRGCLSILALMVAVVTIVLLLS